MVVLCGEGGGVLIGLDLASVHTATGDGSNDLWRKPTGHGYDILESYMVIDLGSTSTVKPSLP